MRRFNSTILEKFDEFDLFLKGMPVGTQEFRYHLGLDFFRKMESSDVSSADVEVSLSAKRVGDTYKLFFTLTGVIGIPCDRCLDEMEHRVDTTYAMSVKYGDEYYEGDDVVVIPESWDAYNVARAICDTVMLTIPIMHTHEEGKCNEEMSRLLRQHSAAGNDSETDDTDDGGSEYSDPRWEALRKLKNNN